MPDYRPTGGPGGYEFDEVAPAGMGIDTSVAAVIADGGLGGASVFNVTAYGATGDGVTDDRLAITAAMAAANAIGGGVVYFPAGTYIVSRDATNSYSLDLPGNNITLLGERHLSWIKHPTGMPNSSVAILRCLGRENIVIDSMGFDGNWGCEVGVDDTRDGLNHTTQRDPKNYGLMLRSTVNAIVRNCAFTQLYGDAIWVGSGGAAEYSTGATNTRIRDCDIDITARDGIALAQKCEGISIKGCRITNTYASPFDTEPGDQPVRDVVLEDCYLGRWWNAANFDRSGNTILTICGGKSTIPSATNYARNYRVRNNTIFGAVLIQDASDILFDGNRVICDWDGHSYAPITVTMYAENIRITNNYVYDRTTVAPGGGIGTTQQSKCRCTRRARTTANPRTFWSLTTRWTSAIHGSASRSTAPEPSPIAPARSSQVSPAPRKRSLSPLCRTQQRRGLSTSGGATSCAADLQWHRWHPTPRTL